MPTARKIEFDKTVPHQVKFNICGLAPNLNKEREWDTMGCGYLGCSFTCVFKSACMANNVF